MIAGMGSALSLYASHTLNLFAEDDIITNNTIKLNGSLSFINAGVSNPATISYNHVNSQIEFTKGIKTPSNLINNIGFATFSDVDTGGAARLYADLNNLTLVNNGNALGLSCPNGIISFYAKDAVNSNLSITVTSDITLKNVVE